MVDIAPISIDPVAVVIVALVGWIAIILVRGLLRQAGINLVSTRAEWGPDGDSAHHHDGPASHVGDRSGHKGDPEGGSDVGH